MCPPMRSELFHNLVAGSQRQGKEEEEEEKREQNGEGRRERENRGREMGQKRREAAERQVSGKTCGAKYRKQ